LRSISRLVSLALFVAAFVTLPSHATPTPYYAPIQSYMGATGVIQPDGALHYDLVRSDLSISINGQAVNSAELAGYVNFKDLYNGAWFVTGSLPAVESQAAAVQAALRVDPNINITAVVNQVALATPHMLWIHFEAQGSSSTLAHEIAIALERINNPQKGVTSVPVALSVIPGELFQDAFIGANGTIAQLNGSVYVFTVPRGDITSYAFGAVPASTSLGVSYTFYVQPLSTANNVVLTTDLSLSNQELQVVRDALVASGLTIGSVHGNYIDDSQRLFNVNAYATGDAATLGNSLYNSLINLLDNE
jgi:hypothetical protein